VSATGSGKTITAAVSALECFPGGILNTTVPTLDLLTHRPRRPGGGGPPGADGGGVLAENDPVLSALGVRTTTNAIQLALG
ncbi:hypothetical protein ACQ9BS_00005, partial [Streptomyces lividans]